MKKLFALILAFIMIFTFASCDEQGENPSGDGKKTEENQNNSQNPGEESKGSYNGNYVFAPPTDNYHLVYSNGSEEARVGNNYSFFEKDVYSFNVNFEKEKVYVPYEGKWYEDTNLYYSDYEGIKKEPPEIFKSMEDGLIHYLRMFGTEESELGEKLKDYYIGDETLLGIKCWVFDSKGINAVYCKYWVDPSNGAVIKTDHYEANYVEELTVYDISYTEMEQRFFPSNYDEVGIL